MGTRGRFGFYYQGNYYVYYNHCDSYPRGLGATLVQEVLRIAEAGLLHKWLQKLQKRISDDVEEEEINAEATQQDVASFENILKTVDRNCKTTHPMWEEYAYVVNFDDITFEFYAKSKLAMAHKLEIGPLKKLLAAFECAVD